MATTTPISVAEYLQRHDEPECELIGGKLIAKPMGTIEHGDMQMRLYEALKPFQRRGLGRVAIEISIRRGDEVRIPDFAFLPPDAKFEGGILVSLPLLAVEIISPSQWPSELFAKCEAYHRWGIQYCWIVEPVRKVAWQYDKGSVPTEVPRSKSLSAGEVEAPLSALFDE